MTSRTDTAIQVQIAVPSPAVGRRIAAELVERRLCACVQIVGPVTSTYRWRGRIETAREWLLFVKTRRGRFAALERHARALHPYDVAEIIATPIERGAAAYLRWLAAETRRPAPSTRIRPQARLSRGQHR